MKVLYLCPSPYLGIRDRAGWSTHMTSVIRALRELGHEVRPHLSAGPARHVTDPRCNPGRRRVLPRQAVPPLFRLARRDLYELLHDRGLDRKILSVCERFGPDVIYERTEVYHAAGARVARRLGLPLILEVNGPLVEEREAWAGMLYSGLARRIEASKYAAADAVVTVSAALADYLCAHGVDRDKIHVVPNAADVDLFHPQRAHPGAIRAQFGLGRRLVIGFVGAFADWHGLEGLIRAMADLAYSRVLDVHLLMVGDGPARTSLRQLALREGLEGRATLPGSVPHDQVPHYLAAMDICVLPSANWYMSPIKLFEYGAMGKPIIAPRTPAVCEVIRDEYDGLLVEPGNVEALTSAIRRLACRPELRAQLAATFQQRVRQQHTWQTVAGRVSRLLEQSVQARHPAIAAQPQAEAVG
jgi:glycosyltransferase involved in cell wall biosynthesis